MKTAAFVALIALAAAVVAVGGWIGYRATESSDVVCREVPDDDIGFACISTDGDPETFRVIFFNPADPRKPEVYP